MTAPRQIKDERLRGTNLDGALDIAREHQIAICVQGGGQPGSVEIVPLAGGSYSALIRWAAPVGVGGRAGRKRAQLFSAEIRP